MPYLPHVSKRGETEDHHPALKGPGQVWGHGSFPGAAWAATETSKTPETAER